MSGNLRQILVSRDLYRTTGQGTFQQVIYNENNSVPNDGMEVLAFYAKEDLKMPVNEELPDELVAECKAIEIKNDRHGR